MILTSYGCAMLQFGAGDRLLAIQVTRETEQRPIAVAASFTPLPIPSQPLSQGRLVVYRGTIKNELDARIVALQATINGGSWEDILGVDKVFYDAMIPFDQQPVVMDFAHFPNALVKAESRQGLGAAIIQPVDLTTAAPENANAVLVFIGDDYTSEDESDVRKWRAK